MTLQEKIAVMQAAERGQAIEFRSSFGDELWFNCWRPTFNFESFEYRVKPVPREILLRVYDDDSVAVQLPGNFASAAINTIPDINQTVFPDSKLLRFVEVME